MSFDTPVLLLVWRRPQTLIHVIDALRQVKPSTLYVACDGPRSTRPDDVEKIQAVRALIESEIDWPCRLFKLYSDVNRGCKIGVRVAIDWYFENVDAGIILEDDCVPTVSFFRYCSSLLDRYRDDQRIWSISGANFQNGLTRGDTSYYFSPVPLVWGWATWRRCWQHYDPDLQQWPALRRSGLLRSVFPDPVQHRYWTRVWDRLHRLGLPDTWDYQWTFTCIVNRGLAIEPSSNLIKNIGFGVDATHTTDVDYRTPESSELVDFRHPEFMVPDQDALNYGFYHYQQRPLILRGARRVRSILRRCIARRLSV